VATSCGSEVSDFHPRSNGQGVNRQPIGSTGPQSQVVLHGVNSVNGALCHGRDRNTGTILGITIPEEKRGLEGRRGKHEELFSENRNLEQILKGKTILPRNETPGGGETAHTNRHLVVYGSREGWEHDMLSIDRQRTKEGEITNKSRKG